PGSDCQCGKRHYCGSLLPADCPSEERCRAGGRRSDGRRHRLCSRAGARLVRWNISMKGRSVMRKVMEKRRWIVSLSLVALLSLLAACSEATAQQSFNAQGQRSTSTDWNAVGQALGKAGAMQPGDVYKVSLPRSDLQVTAGGVQIKPALALGSWVAFKKAGEQTMVMGDLVLTEDEVTPVMTKLQEGGIQQTALHNHILHESPRVMYMHIAA